LDGSKAHEPMLPEIDDDAVRIMTIHGAKGLEFPITVVSGLTTQYRSTGGGVGVLWGEPGEPPSVKLKSDIKTERFEVHLDLEEQMDRPEKDRLLYVALTRARDHLVVSGHHGCKIDAKGEPKPTNCHGRLIHDFATGSGAGLVRPFIAEEHGVAAQGELPLGSPPDAVPIDEPAWQASRSALLETAAVTPVVSATGVAKAFRELAAEADAFEDREDDLDSSDDRLPPQTFRRGRAGTSIGRAVHAVLQYADLSEPDPAVIDQLAESQAWLEAVPDLVDTIRAAAMSALEAPIVASCRTARHWKELYVAAPVGARTIEGYVDLLVESPDGLVIVDYKTDSVSSETEIDEKLEGYARQGAAYACALAESTGLEIADVQFVFAGPKGVTVRSVENLAQLQAEITQWAGEQPVGS
ncbi:MAG: hypothetical protein HKN07_03990, partial [Acidimicrobiia bacterium]|nr:hypothetical protein [Acidimicrobiia bacterium]